MTSSTGHALTYFISQPHGVRWGPLTGHGVYWIQAAPVAGVLAAMTVSIAMMHSFSSAVGISACNCGMISQRLSWGIYWNRIEVKI